MPHVSLLYEAAQKIAKGAVVHVYHAHAEQGLCRVLQVAASVECMQSMKSEVHALQALAVPVVEQWQGLADVALLFPHKNKAQTLYDMACAMHGLKQGGRIIFACPNAHGAKSYQKALAALAGSAQASSKAKCRVCSARKGDAVDEGLLQQWMQAGEVQYLEDLGFYSQVSLFSWNRLDVGTRLLLQHLPELAGRGMDLCCGYGALAAHIVQHQHAVTDVALVDVDARALLCAEKNTQDSPVPCSTHWLDARRDALPQGLDWVVCNPPFHTGQQQDMALGQMIVQQGCRSVRRGGHVWMVANRMLPYEAVLRQELSQSATIIATEGFKIMHGVR